MYVQVRSPKYVCTKPGCHTKVPQVDLERVFQEQLRRFAFSPEKVAASLAEADQTIRAKVELLESLRREDARVAEEAEKVYRLYLAGELTPRGFGARNTPLEERRVQLEAEIPRLQGEIDFLKIQHLSQEEITSAAEDLATRWFDLPLEERRAIVQATMERVTVGRDEIEFSLTYLPSEPPSAPTSLPLSRSSQKGHEPPLGLCCPFAIQRDTQAGRSLIVPRKSRGIGTADSAMRTASGAAGWMR
jgi:site-specific DNA recombinase